MTLYMQSYVKRKNVDKYMNFNVRVKCSRNDILIRNMSFNKNNKHLNMNNMIFIK